MAGFWISLAPSFFSLMLFNCTDALVCLAWLLASACLPTPLTHITVLRTVQHRAGLGQQARLLPRAQCTAGPEKWVSPLCSSLLPSCWDSPCPFALSVLRPCFRQVGGPDPRPIAQTCVPRTEGAEGLAGGGLSGNTVRTQISY